MLPTFEHVKLSGTTLSDVTPQLSLLSLSTSLARIDTFPDALSCTVISRASAVGAVLSSAVTIASAVLVLPLSSVTVNVTLLSPTFTHVNALGATSNVTFPQLSLLPLSTSPAVIDAFPDASSCTVVSRTITVGKTLSTTVTIAVTLAEFPLLSVTVSTTLLPPIFEHVNAPGDTVIDSILQLSLLPLFTCAAVIDTVPVASNSAVMD